ncbi:retrotransposon protein, putative, ty1-copia subclass [Tanacetum coccineum]
MTTTVGNNSVFRSFFEKQKLTGPNFIDWHRQLRLVLSTEDKENYLEHLIPVVPVAPPRQQVPPEALAAHAAWVKGQKEVVLLILLTMDLEIQRNLAHLGAYDMLQELKALYSKQAEQELLQTVREFHTYKQEEGQSISSHVLKMKGYIDNLERLGQPVGQNLAVSLILVSLNKDFDSFMQNYNMHGMGKTVNELHVMLKLHEETLPKKDANPALHAIRAGRVQKNKKPHKAAKGGQGKKGTMGYAPNNVPFAPKPKTPPPPKKENPAKDAICHQCGEVGHWRRNCPVYLTELIKKKKLSQGASTLGIFTTELYSFPNKSWIYDTGCGIHIFITTQGLRGSRKLKPGALSLSMYNVSNKRAKINLDSSYLWHCRLGHISKKRIEKLQHEGLLNSTDIQSLGKCVSCMSGKMARKPYSHQVERAKDLLGLIHTDDYALETAARILNMVPTKKVDKTPYEIWHGQAPKLSYLKVWGCEAFVKRDTLTKPDKLDPRSLNTSLNHEEEDQKFDELQSDINPIRRSTRIRHPTDRLCLYIDAEEHELGDLGEPANYRAALLVLVELPPMLNRLVQNAFQDEKTEHGWCNIPIRILIAIAAYYDYEIWQVDVKTAFLNGHLSEEVYMEQPEGDAAYIIGIKIYRDRSKRLISLCQSTYIEKILKRYSMENSKRGKIPMQKKLKLSKSQSVSTPEIQRMQKIPYASAVGSIMYADMFLVYGGNMERELRVSCYTDAGYLTDADTLRSQTGYVFVLNGGVVDWKSTKQSIFATSSTDDEYIAAFDASKKAVWIWKFISRQSRKIMKSLKMGDVKIKKVDTEDNLADPFTKALAYPKHSELTKNIGLIPASSLM